MDDNVIKRVKKIEMAAAITAFVGITARNFNFETYWNSVYHLKNRPRLLSFYLGLKISLIII